MSIIDHDVTTVDPPSPLTPARERRRPSRLRLLGLGVVLALGILGGAFAVSDTTPASAAAEPWCAKRAATGTHVVQKWVAASGWGWTNWQVRTNVWAADMCNRGDINVSVTIPYNVVTQRGGSIEVNAWARYYNSASRTYGNWIPLKLVSTWPSYTFRPPNGSYIGMNSTTHTLQVAVGTTAWIKQDASRWVPVAQAWTYCGLMYTSPSLPGSCSG